jgi:hypothetical protein
MVVSLVFATPPLDFGALEFPPIQLEPLKLILETLMYNTNDMYGAQICVCLKFLKAKGA